MSGLTAFPLPVRCAGSHCLPAVSLYQRALSGATRMASLALVREERCPPGLKAAAGTRTSRGWEFAGRADPGTAQADYSNGMGPLKVRSAPIGSRLARPLEPAVVRRDDVRLPIVEDIVGPGPGGWQFPTPLVGFARTRQPTQEVRSVSDGGGCLQWVMGGPPPEPAPGFRSVRHRLRPVRRRRAVLVRHRQPAGYPGHSRPLPGARAGLGEVTYAVIPGVGVSAGVLAFGYRQHEAGAGATASAGALGATSPTTQTSASADPPAQSFGSPRRRPRCVERRPQNPIGHGGTASERGGECDRPEVPSAEMGR